MVLHILPFSILNKSNNFTRINKVQEDHNYGEPGPSTIRHSRRITQLSRHQRNPEELEKPVVSNADNSVDPLRIPSISDRLRNRTPRNNASNNDDSDDDKPLHLMVNESPKSRPSRHSARYSDENVMPSSSNPPTSSTRSARNQKRLCYNEDTDEDEIPQPKRQATQGRYV